jgi:hypothetical protein
LLPQVTVETLLDRQDLETAASPRFSSAAAKFNPKSSTDTARHCPPTPGKPYKFTSTIVEEKVCDWKSGDGVFFACATRISNPARRQTLTQIQPQITT